MEEQLISFETAKLAKEKGFDVKIKRYYSSKDGEIKCYYRRGKSFYKKDYLYAAPTQSLLQRWIREEHNIHFKIDPIQVSNPNGYIVGHEISFLGSHIKKHDGAFPKYEEALEKALKEALKLI